MDWGSVINRERSTSRRTSTRSITNSRWLSIVASIRTMPAKRHLVERAGMSLQRLQIIIQRSWRRYVTTGRFSAEAMRIDSRGPTWWPGVPVKSFSLCAFHFLFLSPYLSRTCYLPIGAILEFYGPQITRTAQQHRLCALHSRATS